MTSLNKENLSPAAFIGVRENDIISFGSGEPDLPPPEEVYKILPNYKDFKYGVIQGMEKEERQPLLLPLKIFILSYHFRFQFL